MKEDRPAGKRDSDIEDREVLKDKVRAHPEGTAGGAAAGAIAGTVIGMGAGPIGAALGAAAGAVAGAVRGSGAGDLNQVSGVMAAEDGYWRENYASRPYAGPGVSYEDYGPAYRHALHIYLRHRGQRSWEDVEDELATGWATAKGPSRLTWDEAKPAAHDAWQRLCDMSARERKADHGRASAPSVKSPSA